MIYSDDHDFLAFGLSLHLRDIRRFVKISQEVDSSKLIYLTYLTYTIQNMLRSKITWI